MVFLVTFTILQTFLSYAVKTLYSDTIAFVVCKVLDEPQGKTCSSSTSMRMYICLMAVLAIYLVSFSILLVVYSFIPAPAREVWSKELKRLRRIFHRD